VPDVVDNAGPAVTAVAQPVVAAAPRAVGAVTGLLGGGS
jgi:hypothetical protein